MTAATETPTMDAPPTADVTPPPVNPSRRAVEFDGDPGNAAVTAKLVFGPAHWGAVRDHVRAVYAPVAAEVERVQAACRDALAALPSQAAVDKLEAVIRGYEANVAAVRADITATRERVVAAATTGDLAAADRKAMARLADDVAAYEDALAAARRNLTAARAALAADRLRVAAEHHQALERACEERRAAVGAALEDLAGVWDLLEGYVVANGVQYHVTDFFRRLVGGCREQARQAEAAARAAG